MDAALQRVLEEQIAQPLPHLTTRDIRVPSNEGVATALVGMRRVGKSYLLFQQMAELLAVGVPRSSMLFLNLEDDRLGIPTTHTLDQALEYLDRMEAVTWLAVDCVRGALELQRRVVAARVVSRTLAKRAAIFGASALSGRLAPKQRLTPRKRMRWSPV